MLEAGAAAVIVGNARAAKCESFLIMCEVNAWLTGGGCAVSILK